MSFNFYHNNVLQQAKAIQYNNTELSSAQLINGNKLNIIDQLYLNRFSLSSNRSIYQVKVTNTASGTYVTNVGLNYNIPMYFNGDTGIIQLVTDDGNPRHICLNSVVASMFQCIPNQGYSNLIFSDTLLMNQDVVTNMAMTYAYCINLTGSPVCGPNVTDMRQAQRDCTNLTGSPACGPNVTNMASAQSNCTNLTGSPACGPNVTNMAQTQNSCQNLTGSPVCSNNVTTMAQAQNNCQNLTGSPVCGDNVVNMYGAQQSCQNLTGSPICGPNVTDMSWAQHNCPNLSGDMWINTNMGLGMSGCFQQHNNAYRINIHVRPNSVLNNELYNSSDFFRLFNTSQATAWTLDSQNNCYQNTAENCYIYYDYI